MNLIPERCAWYAELKRLVQDATQVASKFGAAQISGAIASESCRTALVKFSYV